MEIALLPKSGIRIKGKLTTVAVDAVDKVSASAVLSVITPVAQLASPEEGINIFGVGEYEIGGIKVMGKRSNNQMMYSLIVDGVTIFVGGLVSLEKMHQKLAEYNIVVVICNEEGATSFLTSIASNVVIFYGEKAKVVSESFSKENVKVSNKYSSTKDKLPEELETILLANS